MPNLSANDPMKSEVKAESPVYKMRSTSPILRYWLKLINKYLQQCGHKVEAVCHPLDLYLVVDVLFGGQVGAYGRVVVERVEACLKSFTDNFCEGLKGSVNMFWLTLSRMSCSTMPAPVLMV